MIKRVTLYFWLLLLFGSEVRADNAGLRQRQALKDLTTAFSLMCVAAHPDDEDSGALTMARRKWGVRASIVVSNYGEGGQNAAGPELYESLGAVRFHELRAAAAGYGVSRISSLGFVDFGFSKTAEETFRIWGGEDKVVDRLVGAIRKEKPSVIITNHSPDEGHGNHRAVAVALLRAYRLAGDRQYKPELGEPWQAERLFQRMRRGAENSDVVLQLDEKEPATSNTYGQLAYAAFVKHVSQGPWPSPEDPARQNRPRAASYRLWNSASASKLPPQANSFFEGMQQPFPIEAGMNLRIIQKRYQNRLDAEVLPDARTMLAQIQKDLATLSRMQQGLASQFSGEKRRRIQASIDDLANRLRHARGELAGVELDWVLQSVPAAVADRVASPDTLDNLLSADAREIVVGDPALYRLEIRSRLPLRLKSFSVDWPAGWKQVREIQPARESPLRRYGLLRLTAETSPTEPFSSHYMREELPAVTWKVVLTDGKLDIPYQVSTVPKVSPPLLMSLLPDRWLAWKDQNLPVQVELINKSSDELLGELTDFAGARRRMRIAVGKPVTVSLPASIKKQQSEDQQVKFQTASGSIAAVNLRIRPGNIKLANIRRVGLVRHSDSTTEEALQNLGVPYRTLKREDFQTGDLAQFDVILLDHRSYVLVPWLVGSNEKLINYVRNGGHLVVFYQRAGEFNMEAGYPQLAPYPIHLSSHRISVEEAPVRILLPNHPLLHRPNEIDPADFDNWVQERGLYYPDKWDSHYHALLSSNDPNEPSLDGGLLVAPVGKGTYVYTSYVWYRQWKELHNGALQMLANMLAYR